MRYVIHYTEDDKKTRKTLFDDFLVAYDKDTVLERIVCFTKNHPDYDWERATRIMKEVDPNIEDAFVAYDDKKWYWLITRIM